MPTTSDFIGSFVGFIEIDRLDCGDGSSGDNGERLRVARREGAGDVGAALDHPAQELAPQGIPPLPVPPPAHRCSQSRNVDDLLLECLVPFLSIFIGSLLIFTGDSASYAEDSFYPSSVICHLRHPLTASTSRSAIP